MPIIISLLEINLILKTETKTLAICDICKKEDYWDDDWRTYGSFLHQANCPELLPTFCNDICAEKGVEKVESKEWVLPKLKNRMHYSEVIRDKKGY